MAIFIIIMLLGWVVLAFAPSILQSMAKKEQPSNEKSFRPGPSYRTPTFRDYKQKESGPASIKPLAGLGMANVTAGPAPTPDTIRHITFMADNRDIGSGSSLVNPAELTILDHDYSLKAGRHFEGNLSVNGSVRIGSDATFVGNITCSGSVVVSQDSNVVGNIDSGGDIRIESNASVTGSLISAGDVWVYENARVGEPGSPCSLRGKEVIVAPTSRVHGSIWASRNGVHMNSSRAA